MVSLRDGDLAWPLRRRSVLSLSRCLVSCESTSVYWSFSCIDELPSAYECVSCGNQSYTGRDSDFALRGDEQPLSDVLQAEGDERGDRTSLALLHLLLGGVGGMLVYHCTSVW